MEHEEQVERLEREAERMERESERVAERIEDAREDWESKAQDAQVPGATRAPESDAEPAADEADG